MKIFAGIAAALLLGATPALAVDCPVTHPNLGENENHNDLDNDDWDGAYATCPNQPGPQGPVGPQGPQGVAGADGQDGADGAPGPQGEVGPQGPIGPQGPQGVAGNDGADGQDGQDGADGAPGAQGPVGPQGIQGVAGTDGADGQDGAPGPQGPKGDKGDKGDQGVKGADGKDFDFDKSLALSAALSIPAYLEPQEKVSLTGGVGVSSGGDTAFGLKGMLRLNKNWAGFVGGAISEDGENGAGTAGVRVGW
jgi:hypothetical protein